MFLQPYREDDRVQPTPPPLCVGNQLACTADRTLDHKAVCHGHRKVMALNMIHGKLKQSVGQELGANTLRLRCYWEECSQEEEEATCQHLIDSMMLYMINSYAVWLLSALFEILKMSGQLSAHCHIIGMMCTHLLKFTNVNLPSSLANMCGPCMMQNID